MARPRLSTSLTAALTVVLKGAVPEALDASLAEILCTYASRDRDARKRRLQQREAVERIATTGRALQRAMLRADTLFNDSTGPWFVGSTWQAVNDPLKGMLSNLDSWIGWQRPRARRRGNPHEGRAELRICVMGALADAGIALQKHRNSRAARALATILAEADRLDRRPKRERAEFSGHQWAAWLATYRQIETLRQRGRK